MGRTGWDLADCCRVPAVVLVAVRTLYEYRAVAQTFGKHLTTDIVQPNTFSCTTCEIDVNTSLTINCKNVPQSNT